MKHILLFILTLLTTSTFGQDKYNYVHFNKLMEVTGTEFVIASLDNRGKDFEANNKYLLFINTKTFESKQVDFPGDASSPFIN